MNKNLFVFLYLSVTAFFISCADESLFKSDVGLPSIGLLKPDSGLVGTIVRMEGVDFNSTFTGDSVFVNGTYAEIIDGSVTHRTFRVSPGSQTGTVSFYQNGLVAYGPVFKVIIPPQIDVLKPDSGIVGTIVRMEGSNFNSTITGDSIFVNGTYAEIIDGSTTHRTFRVSTGSRTGVVSFHQNGLISNGPVFTVIIPQVSTYAGTGTAGLLDGPRLSSQFLFPMRIGRDFTGQLVFVDAGNHSLRYLDGQDQVLMFAGTGTAGFVNGKTPLTSSFNFPSGLVVNTQTSITYISDRLNHVIRSIDSNGLVSTYAGFTFIGQAGLEGIAGHVDGVASQALFNNPMDIVLDSKGNLFVADFSKHAIRKIDPLGNVTTFAGSPSGIQVPLFGFIDGKGTTALFNYPFGLCIDPNDNLYVADALNHAIRKITPDGTVTTLTGFSGTPGLLNGDLNSAQFNMPTDIDIDASGNIYIADSNNHVIRIIENNGQVKTYAGIGVQGFLDGDSETALFNSPVSVFVMDSNNLLVTDSGNNSIRLINR